MGGYLKKYLFSTYQVEGVLQVNFGEYPVGGEVITFNGCAN